MAFWTKHKKAKAVINRNSKWMYLSDQDIRGNFLLERCVSKWKKAHRKVANLIHCFCRVSFSDYNIELHDSKPEFIWLLYEIITHKMQLSFYFFLILQNCNLWPDLLIVDPKSKDFRCIILNNIDFEQFVYL